VEHKSVFNLVGGTGKRVLNGKWDSDRWEDFKHAGNGEEQKKKYGGVPEVPYSFDYVCSTERWQSLAYFIIKMSSDSRECGKNP